MERHNRFDEAIKTKLGALEDEPSARVWAGVRNEVGTIVPPRASSPWPMRVAAAVALLCVTGLGYYLLDSSSHSNLNGRTLHEQSRIKHIVIVPLDREGKQGNYLANNDTVKQQLHSPQPGRQDQYIAVAPPRKAAQKDTLKPLQQLPPFHEEKNDVIVQHDVPKELDSPKPLSPDNKVPQLPDHKADVRTETAIASASTKRSFKVPGREDLTSENLKKKSGAILGAITNGANSFLGLNASYTEHDQDDHKLTAFNADFGLFKIKKVRTVKN